jgi:hypothetical protein
MQTLRASSAFPFRILVDITFHYNWSRLQHLFQVVKSFCEYPIEAVDIVIVTNTADEEKLRGIKSLCSPLTESNPIRPGSTRTLSIESFPDLADPWHLPWCHKHLITEKFLDTRNGYSHYIHTEDDMVISFENFCYFTGFREVLQDQRLIPSFVRVEFNSSNNRLYVVDQIGVSDLSSRKKFHFGDFLFVNPDYPHNGMFILDRDLALEYAASRSFDREGSVEVRPQWGLCERSSMGLCFENPADGFSCRYVIPVSTGTLKTPYWSWVYHIANNYAKNSRTPFGKTQPDQIFSADPTQVRWSPPTAFENAIWHMTRFAKQIRSRPTGTGHASVRHDLCALCGMEKDRRRDCMEPNCPKTWSWDG